MEVIIVRAATSRDYFDPNNETSDAECAAAVARYLDAIRDAVAAEFPPERFRIDVGESTVHTFCDAQDSETRTRVCSIAQDVYAAGEFWDAPSP